MEDFVCITVAEAQAMQQQGALMVDIRDPHSFGEAHAEGAFHLTNEVLNTFMSRSDVTRPVLVMCYHGNSSKSAARYLMQQGFEQVFSIDGGFEAWRVAFPQQIAVG